MTSYPNKQKTPQRMARKRSRREVYLKNRNETKLRKKLQRQQRTELEAEV